MTAFDFIGLLGGLALFLYGMRIMGDGLEKGSSETLKRAMEKVTNNPFVGFLLGLAVTAVIQSSTATIVLTSGLVASKIISLHQSLGIILGANVGTTITGQIIRLLDVNADGAPWLNAFKPSTLAPVAAIIGILLIMVFKFKSSDNVGNICMGFGVLFTGLLNMTAAVEPLSKSETFSQLFVTLADKPVLGFLAGAGAAFAIQSSSATVGILQTLSTTGMLSFSSVYSVIVGIYLGDCVTTAIVCSIGAKADAKRTGLIHILFNLSGTALVIGGVTLLHHFGVLDAIWDAPIHSGGIADTNTIFKLGFALILLPFCVLFEKLSCKIIKDDRVDGGRLTAQLDTLDETLFESPALALSSAHKVICEIAAKSMVNVKESMKNVLNFDKACMGRVKEDEEYIDALTDHASNYMVHMSPYLQTDEGSRRLNYYIKCVSEFERIGDHAMNLSENAEQLFNNVPDLTRQAGRELLMLTDALDEIMAYTEKTFTDCDCEAARHIEPLEQTIDDLVDMVRENHLARLRNGECNVLTGSLFIDVLVNIERISDQCSNIGVQTLFLAEPGMSAIEHEYLHDLHHGADEKFNLEYEAVREKYLARLKEAEPVTA